MSQQKANEVRCVLVPMAESRILLPNATIAEVITYEKPDPFPQAPEWLLGSIVWHGWQVPVASYARLTNLVNEDEPTDKARIMIVKSLLGSQRIPYLGILVQGLPKLQKITPGLLAEQPDKHPTLGLYSHVTVNKSEAVIPDLDRLAQLIAHAAYGALPITHI